MGTSAPKKQGNQWSLLDLVSGVMLVSVFVFLVLVYTHLGDSLAISGRQALALNRRDSKSRERILNSVEMGQILEVCPQEFVDYMPCEDPKRARLLSRERNFYRERHCPTLAEKLLCLIPPPRDYKSPVAWPESLHKVWYSNMPHSKIAERKGHQGWMREEGSYFIFPGGGTMFTEGALQYIEKLGNVIPLNDGSVRTALDIGCGGLSGAFGEKGYGHWKMKENLGVASFGGYMLKKDVLTLSFAPRDSHKAQIQFALERGIPAFVAMLGTHRLPFPAFAFDLAHCSRCLISFSAYNGSYLLEIDRLLRPGGYFVVSGPPVQWAKEENEWKELQDLAKSICFELLSVEGNTAIWRKSLNGSCLAKASSKPTVKLCDKEDDPNAAWYVPLKTCVSHPPGSSTKTKTGNLIIPNWPKRLNYPSSRLSVIPHGDTSVLYEADMHRWERRLRYYKKSLGLMLGTSRIRNVMDMNAMFGGFGASMNDDPVWVMNVIPAFGQNTLPVIYDRGLIGVNHDWCEAFSTYPRTYDLIHVVDIRSLITGTTESKERCSLVDVILEMDRILRPDGMVLIRDTPEIIEKLSKMIPAIRWTGNIYNTEPESNGKQKLLVANKRFWAVSTVVVF